MQVLDAYNHPLSGRTVLFSTDVGSIDGSAISNEDGIATARLRAGTTLGNALVQATVSGLATSANVPIVAGPPAALQMDSPVRVIVADGTNAATITLTVRDARDRPVAGVNVLFTATIGSITPAATTDANGTATAIFSPGKAQGRALVRAAAGSATAEMDFVLKAAFASVYLAYLQKLEALPVLVNGYFDGGKDQGWGQLVNGKMQKLIYGQAENPAIPTPLSPPYIGWLGGKPSETDQLFQAVSLPGSYTVRLEFGYYTASLENECGRDVATLDALIGSEIHPLTSFGLCTSAATKSWRTMSVDLGALRGQAVVLQFRSILNDTKDSNSNLFLDNLQICTLDQGAPAGVPRCSVQ